MILAYIFVGSAVAYLFDAMMWPRRRSAVYASAVVSFAVAVLIFAHHAVTR